MSDKPGSDKTGSDKTGGDKTGSDKTGGRRERGPQAGGRRAHREVSLAAAGVASRRDAEKMIAESRVKVNGVKIDHPATFVTETDIVAVDGRVLDRPGRARLWRYHKPEGLVTTHKDPEGRATVFDRLPPALPRVMSVGRLDLNSEGLLLLTDDGELKRRLELPANGWISAATAHGCGAWWTRPHWPA